MDEQRRNDDTLFEALNQGKKRKRRRKLRNALIIIGVIVLALVLLVNHLQRKVQDFMSSRNDEVLTWQVSYGTVSTTVSGSGTIRDVDSEELSLPRTVEIDKIQVKENTQVKQGDVLATVDMATVLSSLASLQEQINQKDQALAAAGTEAAAGTLTAGVSGRVKAIYAQAGDDVAACMVEHGALALISQDGYMTLEIPAGNLSAGQSVKLRRENGGMLEARVSELRGETAVLLLGDREGDVDEQVTVLDEEDRELGQGTLSVRNPLRVTGYTGTVERVAVQPGQSVWPGSTVFSLRDTANGARYDAILKERRALEEDMMELLNIYRSGAYCAPFDGTVLQISYGKENQSASAPVPSAASAVSSVMGLSQDAVAAYAQSSGAAASAASDSDKTVLMTLSRDEKMSATFSVDESDILALETGLAAQVTIGSIGDQSYEATVTDVDHSASSASGVTSYSATVEFEKGPYMLSGMSADVVIAIDGTEDVLMVPTDAIHKTRDSSFVYTSYDTETGLFGDPKNVLTGVSNKDYTEIRSGLEEGETVCYMETEDPFMAMMGGWE